MLGKIVLLAGNFAVGKTSIITGDGVQNGLFYHRDNGWKLFGSKRGADDLKGNKLNNIHTLQQERGNIIIAGKIYCYPVDLVRYSKNHKLKVCILETSKENTRKRSMARSGKFSESTWASTQNCLVYLYRRCVKESVEFIIINNNRSLEESKKEFWSFANA